MFAGTMRVNAASAGCYIVDGVTYQAATCPNDAVIRRGIENGNCYLAAVGSGGQTSFRQTDCTTFSLGDSPRDYNPDYNPDEATKDTTKIDTFTVNPAGDCRASGSDNCIAEDIQLAVNFLSAGVGIIITMVIIFAGLQYLTARDNPQAVQAAKTRITNAVIALIAFVFVYAFLQWIVPGGVFSGSAPTAPTAPTTRTNPAICQSDPTRCIE